MTRYAAAYARLPRNARGALWMVASAIKFTVMTMLGAGIVMASTIYITLREARLGKPQPPPTRVD